jgi:NlpC/P60 family putative phage cell wall peptidase
MMLADPDHILRITRSWIGTPYHHQASVKDAGTDCLGLIRGVWRALYAQEPESVPAYSKDWAEPQADEKLWQAARRHLMERPQDVMQPGDVLLFRMRTGAVAKHLGILGAGVPHPTFIHAYSGHGVVESPLSPPWRRRVVAAFAFPKEIV